MLLNVKLFIANLANVTLLFGWALGKDPSLVATFRAVVETAKLAIARFFGALEFFKATIALGTRLDGSVVHWLSKRKNCIIVFVLEGKHFAVNVNDELLVLLFQLKNQIVHHCQLCKPTQLLVEI